MDGIQVIVVAVVTPVLTVPVLVPSLTVITTGGLGRGGGEARAGRSDVIGLAVEAAREPVRLIRAVLAEL